MVNPVMHDQQLVDKICRCISLTTDLKEALELTYLLESIIKEGLENEDQLVILWKYSSAFNELPS
jgi:hypothetical protein